MSEIRRSCKLHDVCMAIRTSFPGSPADRWFHGTFGVEWIEDETQDHVEFGDDAELESEIEAIVGGLEPIEESDAIEVLATWKKNQDGMAQEKLNLGLTTPVRQNSNSTSIAKNVPKPDLARLAGCTRSYSCPEVGHCTPKHLFHAIWS